MTCFQLPLNPQTSTALDSTGGAHMRARGAAVVQQTVGCQFRQSRRDILGGELAHGEFLAQLGRKLLLSQLAKRTGHHGEADRMARARYTRIAKTRSADIIVGGLHQYLENFLEENARLHFAVGRQFKFA